MFGTLNDFWFLVQQEVLLLFRRPDHHSTRWYYDFLHKAYWVLYLLVIWMCQYVFECGIQIKWVKFLMAGYIGYELCKLMFTAEPYSVCFYCLASNFRDDWPFNWNMKWYKRRRSLLMTPSARHKNCVRHQLFMSGADCYIALLLML